jgi:hypothetical protein
MSTTTAITPKPIRPPIETMNGSPGRCALSESRSPNAFKLPVHEGDDQHAAAGWNEPAETSGGSASLPPTGSKTVTAGQLFGRCRVIADVDALPIEAEAERFGSAVNGESRAHQ